MTAITTQPGAAFAMRASHAAEVDFRLATSDRDVVYSGEVSGSVTIGDAVFSVFDPADFDSVQDVLVESTRGKAGSKGFAFESLDTGVATINQQGDTTWVSNGTARILVRCLTTGMIRRVDVAVSHSGGEVVQVFDHWATGTLAAAMSDAVDDAIATGDAIAIKPMYSSGNTRNASCWGSRLADVSCIDREKPNAHLIAQQFGLQANHYIDPLDVYVAMDGEVQTCGVVARRRIGATDISVVKYAAPLPTKFLPALLPPADLATRFDQLSIGVPVLATDQQKHALIHELRSITGGYAKFKPPQDSRRKELWEQLVDGDSGGGVFAMVPSSNPPYSHRLMSLSAWTGPTGGPDYSAATTDIVAAIVDMGGSVSDVEIADCSAFVDFGA